MPRKGCSSQNGTIFVKVASHSMAYRSGLPPNQATGKPNLPRSANARNAAI
jgi:hypothetical protein